jgi:hypothetical protein
MKKLISIIILAVMLMASNVWAVAGSCVQTPSALSPYVFQVKFVCTGDSTNGTLPTQTIDSATMATLTGNYYLYTVTAYPTVGGTAPDAADVAVKMDGMDLLGAKGVNLIHATATYDTLPYSAFMSSYRYPMVTNTLTYTVTNQGTVSATWTTDLLFVR